MSAMREMHASMIFSKIVHLCLDWFIDFYRYTLSIHILLLSRLQGWQILRGSQYIHPFTGCLSMATPRAGQRVLLLSTVSNQHTLCKQGASTSQFLYRAVEQTWASWYLPVLVLPNMANENFMIVPFQQLNPSLRPLFGSLPSPHASF